MFPVAQPSTMQATTCRRHDPSGPDRTCLAIGSCAWKVAREAHERALASEPASLPLPRHPL